MFQQVKGGRGRGGGWGCGVVVGGGGERGGGGGEGGGRKKHVVIFHRCNELTVHSSSPKKDTLISRTIINN